MATSRTGTWRWAEKSSKDNGWKTWAVSFNPAGCLCFSPFHWSSISLRPSAFSSALAVFRAEPKSPRPTSNLLQETQADREECPGSPDVAPPLNGNCKIESRFYHDQRRYVLIRSQSPHDHCFPSPARGERRGVYRPGEPGRHS